MNFRRLQYFLAVVDAGTVTAAAERLHVAQPAVSRQLKTLERELRLQLFEAQGNRLALTSAGRALVPTARRLMVETRGFEEAATVLRTGRVEELVASTTSASLRVFLAPFIATTGPDDPKIIAREVSHFDMTDSLRLGCDFAISPAAPDGALRHVPLGKVALRAFVSPDHEWARTGVTELPISAFAGSTAILASHHSVSRYILDDALSRAGVAFPSVTECDDGQTVVALAAAGRGVGFATEGSLYGAHPIVVLDDARAGGASRPLALPLHVAWIPGHFAETIIEGIAHRIRDFLTAQGITLAE
ncbi:LysR family transcriptional regulator [Sinomonas sp. JGH33]|uniref:LysR family transcriptional regulator n=1 Tax=Sinomonas terricola TaxID=3110330 RepID=A0ABU5T7X7_9MICC|nr:LysR family transcriptional regulator [Sinomonas sp. JGH33]MEA5455767.1 LysR family transcriptional regulator [Sinomonas sp. JGH33]